MKSNLLINEPPLTVSPTLATVLGLDEAIVIQQLHYWLSNVKNAGRVENGEKWVYNTYEAWQEGNFPFWSVDKIQRVFLKLEKQGIIISAQLDAKSRDMRKFYRIDYDAICALHDAVLRPSNTAKLHDVNGTETTTENTNPIPQDMPIDWYIQNGYEVPDELTRQKQIEEAATGEFESALGFGQLPWDSVHTWQTFKKWVIKIYQAYPDTFRKYAEWRAGKGKYDAMSNKQIRQAPAQFVDTGYPAFMAHTAMSVSPDWQDRSHAL